MQYSVYIVYFVVPGGGSNFSTVLILNKLLINNVSYKRTILPIRRHLVRVRYTGFLAISCFCNEPHPAKARRHYLQSFPARRLVSHVLAHRDPDCLGFLNKSNLGRLSVSFPHSYEALQRQASVVHNLPLRTLLPLHIDRNCLIKRLRNSLRVVLRCCLRIIFSGKSTARRDSCPFVSADFLDHSIRIACHWFPLEFRDRMFHDLSFVGSYVHHIPNPYSIFICQVVHVMNGHSAELAVRHPEVMDWVLTGLRGCVPGVFAKLTFVANAVHHPFADLGYLHSLRFPDLHFFAHSLNPPCAQVYLAFFCQSALLMV